MTDQHPFPWDSDDPAFPWEAGQITTMPVFLDAYTLHDSQLARLHFETYDLHVGDAFAEVLWDTVWIGEQFAAAGTPLESDPTLFIRFHSSFNVHAAPHDLFAHSSTIATVTSSALTQTEQEAIVSGFARTGRSDLAPDQPHETAITMSSGGEVRFVHAGDICLLCIAARGLVLIPGL